MANNTKNSEGFIYKIKQSLGKMLHIKTNSSNQNINDNVTTTQIEDPIITARKKAHEILNNIELIVEDLKSDSMAKANGHYGLRSEDVLKKSSQIKNMIAELRNLSATCKDGEIQKIFEEALNPKYADYAESRYLQTILKERQAVVVQEHYKAQPSNGNISVSKNKQKHNSFKSVGTGTIDPIETDSLSDREN